MIEFLFLYFQPNETVVGSVDDVVDVRYPVKNDIVVDMEALILVLEDVFRQLSVSPKGSSVMVGLTANTPPEVREQVIKTFYEHFDCGSLFVAINEVLAMYARGLTDGLAVLCRDGSTTFAPNLDGFAVKEACVTADSKCTLTEALCHSINNCREQRGDDKTTKVVRNIIICGENRETVDIDSIRTCATSSSPGGSEVNVELSNNDHVCWIGGSILCAIETYKPLPVLKSDFETKGMQYALEKMA